MAKKPDVSYSAEARGVLGPSAAFRDLLETYDPPEGVLDRFEISARAILGKLGFGRKARKCLPKSAGPMAHDANVAIQQVEAIRAGLAACKDSDESAKIARDAVSFGWALATMYLRPIEGDTRSGRKRRQALGGSVDARYGLPIEREARRRTIVRAWRKLREQRKAWTDTGVDKAIAVQFKCSDRTVRRYKQWVSEHTHTTK